MPNHQLKFVTSTLLKKKPVTLITFDVDGTLLQGSNKKAEASVHARAFMNAIGRVFGEHDSWHEINPSPTLILPPEKYHGCTDGLIALNLAKYGFDIPTSTSFNLLPTVFSEMTNFVNKFNDDEIARGIEPLPKVIETLTMLAQDKSLEGHFLCGLVTGNVEAIARRKMKATGITQTKILSRPAFDQSVSIQEETDNVSAFLGGYGSDFCSGDIVDQTRIYKDRGEQILIAIKRAQSLLSDNEQLVRIVHVGDAPADCLALKYCFETYKKDDTLSHRPIMSIIAVATGKFSSDTLQTIVGEKEHGYEPHVLELGIADPRFISLCGITTTSSCDTSISSHNIGGSDKNLASKL